MKKRCSPQGMASTVGVVLALAILASVMVVTVLSAETLADGSDVVLIRVVFSAMAVLMLAGVAVVVCLLKRAFRTVELSPEGIRENDVFMPWSEIKYIFVLPEPPLKYALVEKRICFAREKRQITADERRLIFKAGDVLSVPFSDEAVSYVRQHTDAEIDFRSYQR